jgi:ubiquinone/menaquinone biosynthesis C-methylase UbiE
MIADIGSGTGILSVVFLHNGNTVFGVEPNNEMRIAAEQLLRHYPNFKSVNGTAEATTLPDHSVDLITAGQAFHWFDQEKTKKEFRRIGKPGGSVVLVWNTRRTDTSPFLKAYEELLLRYSNDYQQIDHRNVNEAVLSKFFISYARKVFPNSQQFDFEGLKGRLLSSSYVPLSDDERFMPMMAELKNIFDRTQQNGTVTFEYDTEVYAGTLE